MKMKLLLMDGVPECVKRGRLTVMTLRWVRGPKMTFLSVR